MKTNILKESNTVFELLFVYVLIWGCGGASVFQNFLNGNGVVPAISIIAVCAYLLNNRKYPLLPNYVLVPASFLVSWGLLGTIITGINKNYFYLITGLYVSYTCCKIYSTKYFYYYEKVVTCLSVLSLILFVPSLIIPELPALFKQLSVVDSGVTMESNILIFGLAPSEADVGGFLPRRNIGFAWEAGRFSVIVIIALFLNIIRNKFDVFRKKDFWILLITLISTQSTTGYVALLVPFMLYIINTRKIFLAINITVLAVVAFSSLAFLSDKIGNLLYWYKSEVLSLPEIQYMVNNDMVYVPQRFEGIYYDFLNLINDPIWGYGPLYQNSFVNRYSIIGVQVYSSEGILQVFAAAGVIVGLTLYYNLFKSSKRISRLLNYKGGYIFALLFFIINFSYNMWFVTCFFVFVLFSYFDHYENFKYNNSNI